MESRVNEEPRIGAETEGKGSLTGRGQTGEWGELADIDGHFTVCRVAPNGLSFSVYMLRHAGGATVSSQGCHEML